MKNKKLMSLLLALVMILGVITPALATGGEPAGTGGTETKEQTAAKEAAKGVIDPQKVVTTRPESTVVNIFKIRADEYYGAPWKHNGGKLSEGFDITKLGKNVSFLEGVSFKIYRLKGTGTAGAYSDNDYKEIATMEGNRSAYDNATTMDANTKFEVAAGTGLTNGVTDKTDANGLASVTLGEGIYWVVEHEKPESPSISRQIAVPFALTLPYTLMSDVMKGGKKVEAGTAWLNEVNVYPKNIVSEDTDVQKTFGQGETTVDDNTIKTTSNYKSYTDGKPKAKKSVGDEVKYVSTTIIKRNATYTEISWEDLMSKGLKYNDNLTIDIEYVDDNGATQTVTNFTPGSNLTKTDYGFTLAFTVEQLILRAAQGQTGQITLKDALLKGDVKFTFKYSATVTSEAVNDKPLANNITFRPKKPTPPPEITPKDKEIIVDKSWDKGEEPPAGTHLTYTLIEGGKVVADIQLTNGSTGKYDLGNGITFVVGDNWYKGKFTGLVDTKNYKVIESITKYDAAYTANNENGTISIKNTKTPNTITPNPPLVFVGGKKFVKTDSNAGDNRLAGAEFIVKRKSDNKYLAFKTADEKKLKEAMENAYKKVVKASEDYNKARAAANATDDNVEVTIDGVKYTGKTNIFAEIAKLQAKVDEAQKAARDLYEWTDTEENAQKFVSGADGKFLVDGLAYGEYELIEVKAPQGFALNKTPIVFTVDNGSINNSGNIDYELVLKAGEVATKATNVINRPMVIPQTGGIGTAIFGVVGIALMAGAVIAMRKRSEA